LIEVFEHNIDKVGHVFCHPWYYLLTLTSIEVIIILFMLFRYLGKISYNIELNIFSVFFSLARTIEFNKKRARPDASQEDYLSTFAPTETSPNEIGFRFVYLFFLSRIFIFLFF